MATDRILLGIVLLLASLAIIVVAKPDILSSLTDSVSGFQNNGPAASPDMNGPMNNIAANAAPSPTMNNNNNISNMPSSMNSEYNSSVGSMNNGPVNEGFANSDATTPSLGGPAAMPFPAGNAPSNCYPKNQLNPTELLPSDPNSKWSQVNPQGAGDIAGKNYLNAGALIGVNTVGQSLRNASHDLRSEPANPQVAVSPWFNSTIEPDTNRKLFEIS
jgi:hypothetical protein